MEKGRKEEAVLVNMECTAWKIEVHTFSMCRKSVLPIDGTVVEGYLLEFASYTVGPTFFQIEVQDLDDLIQTW